MLNLRKPKSSYLDEAKQITREEENWEIERDNLERRNKIRSEYRELREVIPSKLTTSKKALIFLFISCTFIEIFTAWVTVRSINLAFALGMMPDFTPLVALIGSIVSEVIGLAAYYAKSVKENTKGGITFESAAARSFRFDEDIAVG